MANTWTMDGAEETEEIGLTVFVNEIARWHIAAI